MRPARYVPLAVLVAALSTVALAGMPPALAAGQVSVFLSGLDWPIALAFADDGRVLFAERFTGSIRIIEDGSVLETPFYTLNNTTGSGERGLLGLALDPDFPSTPYVYAYQTYDDTLNGTIYNRIVRILASGNVGLSHEVILRMPPLAAPTNHNGGVIAFGPDGKLYAVVGENAFPALAQDPTSPMGKVLRMNADGSMPADNPFAGNESWHPLVFSYGHRNMFGLAFHPNSGGILVTENGPECNDEVSLLTSGGNFGWGPSYTCSTPPPPPDNTNRDGPDPIQPIWWWNDTICPTNAAAYGGPNFPSWRGDLFLGDCNHGNLHRLDLAPPDFRTVGSDTILWTAPSAILDVEEGPDGAIWFTTPTTIYRYWDSAQPPVASFTASPNPSVVGTMVQFDGSASHDPDGDVVSYDWAFGDSTGASGLTASHAYASPGTYRVVLLVTDNESYTATSFRDVVIQTGPLPPQVPFAQFEATPRISFPGVPVAFDASGSYDVDGTIVAYDWDFGDSTTGTGEMTTHAYQERGLYTATLTIRDDDGMSDEASSVIEVRNRAPQIASSSPASGPVALQAGERQTFVVVASDPDGDHLVYTWRVDGVAASENQNSFDFLATSLGHHTVNVTVSDGLAANGEEWTVTVSAVSPAAVDPGPIHALLVAAMATAIAIAAAVALLWRRRRKEEPGAPGPPP